MDMRALLPAPGNPAPHSRRGRRGGLIALAAAGVLTLTIAHTLLYRAAERRLRHDLAAAGLAQAPLDIRHLGWSRSEVSLTLGGDARTEPVLILDRLLVDGGLADVLRPGGPGGATPGHRDLTVLAATLTVPAAALPSRSGDGRFIWEAPLLRLNALPLGGLSFSDARVRVMAAPLLGRRFDLRLTGQLQHLDTAAGGGAPTLAGALAVSVSRDAGNDGNGEGAPPLVSAPSPDSAPMAGDLDLGTLEVRAEPGRLTLLLGGAGLTGRLTVREPGGGAAAAGAEGGDSGTCALEATLDDIAAVRPVLAGVRLPHGTLHVEWRRGDPRTQTLSMEFTSRDTVAVAGGAPLALFQARLAGYGRVGRGWWGDASADLRGPLRLAAADGGLLLSLGAGNARLSVREGDWVRPGQGELPPMTLRYDLGPVTAGPVAFTRLMAGDSRLSLGAEGGGWRWTLWPGRGALAEGAGWRVALPMEPGATGPEATGPGEAGPGEAGPGEAEAGTALSGWFGGDGVWRMDGRGPLSAAGSVPVQPDGDPIVLRLRADRFALRRDARGDLALSVTGLVPEPPVPGGIDAAGALPPLSLALTGHREDDGALTVAGTLGQPGSAPPMPVPLPPALTITGTLGADGRQAAIDVATPEAAMSGAGMGAGMGGRLGGRAHLRWMEAGPAGRSGWQGDAVVTARQVTLSGGAGSGSGSGSGEGAGWSVDGLDGSLALTSLFPLRTVSAQHLTAHRLMAGAMVIDDPALDVAAGAGTWRIIGGRGDWAGGELTVRPGGAGDAVALLEARGVRLSRLLPGLMAAGYGPDAVLAGALRVDGGPDGVAIRDGMLAAPAGTALRQDAGAPPAFDPRRNRDVILLTAALRNMTFDRLAVRIDGPLGAPRLRLVGHGLNPDFYGGYPVDVDVDVSDLSGGGPVGASSGR